MRVAWLLALSCLTLANGAWGQRDPDAEWGRFPADAGVSARPGAAASPEQEWVAPPTSQPAPAPPPVLRPAAPLRVQRAPGLVSQPTRRAPEPPNRVSLLGAEPLGHLTRGWLATVGFPVLSLRFAVGLGDRVDLGVGFDTFYVSMNEPLLTARVLLVRSQGWCLGLTFEGGWAFFLTRAAREVRGARWLTGRRDIDLAPGVVFSYQGAHPRAARFFGEVRYLLALDTEPYATDPLAGVPPSLIVGHNLEARGGAELPLSAKTAFVFWLGVQVHFRAIDAPVMPQVGLGVVTSF